MTRTIKCACPCRLEFVPKRPWQRFATPECRTQYWSRPKPDLDAKAVGAVLAAVAALEYWRKDQDYKSIAKERDGKWKIDRNGNPKPSEALMAEVRRRLDL